MPRGITKRRPITVTALLDAAMELFAEQGYGAILHTGHLHEGRADQGRLLLQLRQQGRPVPRAPRSELGAGAPSGDRRAMPAGDVLGGLGDGGIGPRWRTPTSTGNGRSCPWSSPCTRSVIRRWRDSSSITSCACDRSSRSRDTEALERAERLPTIPVDELARMIVAVTEGSDIQVLTDGAGGAVVQSGLGPRAVRALLGHFSVPTGSAIPQKGGRSR